MDSRHAVDGNALMNEIERERQLDTLEYQWRELDRHNAILELTGMQKTLRDRLYKMWMELRSARYYADDGD